MEFRFGGKKERLLDQNIRMCEEIRAHVSLVEFGSVEPLLDRNTSMGDKIHVQDGVMGEEIHMRSTLLGFSRS